ncbi:MAG: hypothetical protein IJ087_18195, partial [Eggerthellaceae bacterium]|nr:hypothetical protein [Eggerthellaceae bacterium]
QRSKTRSGLRSRGEDAHPMPCMADQGDFHAPRTVGGLPDPARMMGADGPRRASAWPVRAAGMGG